MIRQGVLVRGTNEGLTIYLNEHNDFREILEELKDKFGNANAFFRGASVIINSGNRTITPNEKLALINLCQNFELAGIEFVSTPMLAAHRSFKQETKEQENNTLILKKTIRSGQRISHKGNVVIIGDVNPGAEIIASGDIIVMGCLRGVVHAGAQGNLVAEVYANSLQPTQLRIAQYIARSPDGHFFKKLRKAEPEKARVKDGQIVIERVAD